MKSKNKIIDIIFPSTACSVSEAEKIKTFLTKNNFDFNIFLEKELALETTPNHEFPLSAELRFIQLQQAIANPHSSIIWCGRGGYGSAELLPFLQKLEKPKNKKIFIGFSDISSINNFLIQEWDWSVISAPVLAQVALEKVNEKSIEAILNLLNGKISELKYELNLLNKINLNSLEAPVIGGCISVLSGSFATKNQLNWENKILFLEDEGEDGERLDRYFTQIVTVIIEQKKIPAAILLGNFLESNPHGTPKAKNIEIAIERFVEKITENNLPIPIFAEKSKCLGHSKNMMPLLLGCNGEINGLQLTQRIK